MQQEKNASFIAWVKIRIGEPLTAIQIDDERVSFGSISGYVGYLKLNETKPKYFELIDEQLIRGIFSMNNRLYIAIGDRQIRIKNFANDEDEIMNISRVHTASICSNSMTMMHKQDVVIFCASPTQNGENLQVEDRQPRNLYQLNVLKRDVRVDRNLNFPNTAVPFDFDGQRILWMTYLPQKKKSFQYYDLQKKQSESIPNVGSNYHFISHGRLIGRELIFAQNNKNVKSYHMDTKVLRDLYSHNSSIVAFNIVNRHQPEYSLISVDFNGFVILWKGLSILKKFNLWDVQKVPQQIIQHQYLFDMGYPYYVKMHPTNKVIAVTTDLGLFVFKIN